MYGLPMSDLFQVIFAVGQKGGKMSAKLVRYKDVCNAVIPMIADMLQKGDVEPANDTLKALGALEDVKTMVTPKDVDLAKAVKEYCKAQRDNCIGCKYHDVGRYEGCIFTCDDVAPEYWTI